MAKNVLTICAGTTVSNPNETRIRKESIFVRAICLNMVNSL